MTAAGRAGVRAVVLAVAAVGIVMLVADLGVVLSLIHSLTLAARALRGGPGSQR